MKKTLIVAAAIVGGLAVCTGVATGAYYAFAGEKTEHAVVKAAVHKVIVRTDAGDVRIVQSDGPVLIRQKSRYLRHAPKLTRTLDGGVLRISGNCGNGFLSLCSTDVRVAVPKGVEVDVRTNAGDVRVASVATGDVQARTNAGDISLDLLRASGLVAAVTNAGDVRLTVPAGRYAVEVDTNAGDGDVRGIVQDERAPHRIDAQTNAGDVDVQAR